MKHETFKYSWNNCFTVPIKENIWLRDTINHNNDIAISECKVGEYIMCLNLFCHLPEPWQSLTWKSNMSEKECDKIWDEHLIYGYNFKITNTKNETIYLCALENNSWFDTKDIDCAEKTAEYIFKLINL